MLDPSLPVAQRSYEAALDAAYGAAARCRALIGLAPFKRVTDHLDQAFTDLQAAQVDALAHGLLAERARIHRIHFLRGNLSFPRGDWERCLREHGAALDTARQAGLVELEAMWRRKSTTCWLPRRRG